MRLWNLFLLGGCGVFFFGAAFGQSYYQLPSKVYNSPFGDDLLIVNLPITVDPSLGLMFGTHQLSFILDVSKVDMMFRSPSGVYKASDGVYADYSVFPLSLYNYVKLGAETQSSGSPTCLITRLGASGTNLFEITFTCNCGGGLPYTSPSTGSFVNGDGSSLQFIVHTNEIIKLPNETYQITSNDAKSLIHTASQSSSINGLTLNGGSFTVHHPVVNFTGTVKLRDWFGSSKPINQLPVQVLVDNNAAANMFLTRITDDVGQFSLKLSETTNHSIRIKPVGFLAQRLAISNNGIDVSANFFGADGHSGLIEGDVDNNNIKDDADLIAIILDFGKPSSGFFGATDTNGDGVVDDYDLLNVIIGFLQKGDE